MSFSVDMVFIRVTEEFTTDIMHIRPVGGRKHALSMHCWCKPTSDCDELNLIYHHEDNAPLTGDEELY